MFMTQVFGVVLMKGNVRYDRNRSRRTQMFVKMNVKTNEKMNEKTNENMN